MTFIIAIMFTISFSSYATNSTEPENENTSIVENTEIDSKDNTEKEPTKEPEKSNTTNTGSGTTTKTDTTKKETLKTVYVDGEEKVFTTKEFDLLTFLAENPNHVFTKDELFREIWDMDSVGDIATVTVHIKKIREKIEYDTSKPQYIETIWGVGYRFKV